jgi:phosphatidylethanolamine-binding protein (PEBP) family uncharacterized protein
MDYVEWTLSTLLKNVRGHEDKIFTKGPAFSGFPEPSFEVTSPDCGPSGSQMSFDHTQEGQYGTGKFPELQWKVPPGIKVKEHLLISQDVDAPLPNPIVHGIYYGIPAGKTGVTNADFKKLDGVKEPNALAGGFRYGKNFRGTIYSGPKALKGHGPHRYFFLVVGLTEPLNEKNLSGIAKPEEIAKEIDGKVAGWGKWIGVSERKFNK